MGRPHTTIGAERFLFRRRDGIRRLQLAIAARQTGLALRYRQRSFIHDDTVNPLPTKLPGLRFGSHRRLSTARFCRDGWAASESGASSLDVRPFYPRNPGLTANKAVRHGLPCERHPAVMVGRCYRVSRLEKPVGQNASPTET